MNVAALAFGICVHGRWPRAVSADGVQACRLLIGGLSCPASCWDFAAFISSQTSADG